MDGSCGIEPRPKLGVVAIQTHWFSFVGFWRSRGKAHFLVTTHTGITIANRLGQSADDSSRLLELHFFSRAHLWVV